MRSQYQRESYTYLLCCLESVYIHVHAILYRRWRCYKKIMQLHVHLFPDLFLGCGHEMGSSRRGYGWSHDNALVYARNWELPEAVYWAKLHCKYVQCRKYASKYFCLKCEILIYLKRNLKKYTVWTVFIHVHVSFYV